MQLSFPNRRWRAEATGKDVWPKSCRKLRVRILEMFAENANSNEHICLLLFFARGSVSRSRIENMSGVHATDVFFCDHVRTTQISKFSMSTNTQLPCSEKPSQECVRAASAREIMATVMRERPLDFLDFRRIPDPGRKTSMVSS